MKIGERVLVVFLLLMVLPSLTRAAVFDVDTIDEIKQALNDAVDNGEDDTINISAGTYDFADLTGGGFLSYYVTYSPAEDHALTIQSVGGDAVIYGGGSQPIMRIDIWIAGESTDNAHVTIKGITFQAGSVSQEATPGAGLFVRTKGGNIFVENCAFLDNRAYAIYQDPSVGGAFFKADSGGTLTVKDSVFKNNEADTEAGGLKIVGGGTVINNVFDGNSAGIGGGAYFSLANDLLTLTNNTFINNSSTFSDFTVTGGAGGGFYIRAFDGTADVYNNIIRGNSATSGYGEDIYLENDPNNDGIGATMNFYNNDYSDLDSEIAHNLTQVANIDQVPSLTADYHLLASSLCVDVGNNAAPSLPATDYEGDNRIIDGNGDLSAVADMGADEYAPPTPTPSPSPTPTATPTTTPSVTPTPTSSPTPTATPSTTPTPEGYKTPTATPTVTPSPTPTPTPPPTPSPTPTPIDYKSPTPTATSSPTVTPTATIPPTPSPAPCFTPRAFLLDSGDYDGDGIDDIAVFRPSTGLWAVRSVTRLYYGNSCDVPVSADYDGDGTTDCAIFRGSISLWAVRGVTRLYFGTSSDLPVPGDYDGDGSCEAGIFREGSGMWAVRSVTRAYFGGVGDMPTAGDYDGDGFSEIALFRSGSGMWAIRGLSRIYYGGSNDTAVPGDYDGDWTWEVGIFRPSSGLWAIRLVSRIYYGASGDRAVPADYNGDSADDVGIFRGTAGLWAVRSVSRAYYGSSGDIPATR